MATAPQPPPDAALDFLGRIEPMLAAVSDRLATMDGRLAKIEAAVAHQGEAVAELRGRVTMLPTLWQIVGTVLGINAGIMALGFALATLLRR